MLAQSCPSLRRPNEVTNPRYISRSLKDFISKIPKDRIVDWNSGCETNRRPILAPSIARLIKHSEATYVVGQISEIEENYGIMLVVLVSHDGGS